MSDGAIGNIDARIARALLPTRGTLKRRQNLPYQLYRGAALMLRIMRMVVKGHAAGH